MTGYIMNYNNEKGYGFINCEDENIFFHVSNIRDSRLPELGNVVTFDIIEDDRGKKAVNIKIKDEAPKTAFIKLDNIRIKSSNIKNYGINDESSEILNSLLEDKKRYDDIVSSGKKDKIVEEFAKYENAYEIANENEGLDYSEYRKNELFLDYIDASSTGDSDLENRAYKDYQNYIKTKFESNDASDSEKNKSNEFLEHIVSSFTYSDYYLISYVESPEFDMKLQEAQKGQFSYLYITTYQGDNYKFYQGQHSFDIYHKLEELDTLL